LLRAELHPSGRPFVQLQRDPGESSGAWARIQEACGRGIIGGSQTETRIRADVFMAELEAIRDVRRIFGTKIELGPTLASQIQDLIGDRRAREAVADQSPQFDEAELRAELRAAGFVRELKPFQLRNLSRIIALPHAADFSVPGAGKTTVALANFALNRARGKIKRLLVVAPIAAFDAWKDDSKECLDPVPNVVVHGGGEAVIPKSADILLTNYNRLSVDYDRIREFVGALPTQVVLDEAHRIKRGVKGIHGQASLDLAYAARRRDVLTGTPAPQGAYDLIALLSFLYPAQDHQILPPSVYDERLGRDRSVLSAANAAICRYFVRTAKSGLDLPETNHVIVKRAMGPIQQAVYEALLGRYRGSFALETRSRHELDRLGRITMYLLEAASNPMLLVAGSDKEDDPTFEHPPLTIRPDEPLMGLLSSYNKYEIPWKYEEVKRLVAEAAARGEKVLVWSSFVRNLKILQKLLAPFNPSIIHGGIPAIDEDVGEDVICRKNELNRFKYGPSTVLLANPAACGEGVSLHHWCHHAIYLDRSFNAGQFLQSQDRIHRLGLKPGTLTRFTSLVSEGTIDESVNDRLRDKVVALSILMNDPGLVSVALPDPDENRDDLRPLFEDDESAVVSHIRGSR
jgi:SNF2 family DNA or RNA helicase